MLMKGMRLPSGPAALPLGPISLGLKLTGWGSAASEWLGWRMTEFSEGWAKGLTRRDPPVDNTPRVVSNDGGAATAIMRPVDIRTR